MPIDVNQWNRDLAAVIDDLPVKCRFPAGTGSVFSVSFHDSGASLAILEPGTNDIKNAAIVALKSRFIDGLPEDEDVIEIQKPGLGWEEYEVKSIAGADDPSIGEVTIVLEAPK